MGYSIKRNNKIAIKEETGEGTFIAATGEDFIKVTNDGLTLEASREELQRDLLGQGLTATQSRAGMWEVTGALKTEMKANGTEGAEPEFGLLIESCLGNKRSVVTKTSSDADGGTYSATVICLANGDAAVYSVGDIVMTKRAANYHISPIVAVDTVADQNKITLLIADPAGAYVDGIEIAALTTYLGADEGHPSFSVSKFIEDAVLEKAAGCKCTGMSIESFTTGQQAFLNFAIAGLSTDRSVSALAVTPSYDEALPPIILEACVYQDGVAIAVNEVTLSVENEIGFITSTCSEQGKLASRMTKRSITGSINPYKANNSVANWTLFDNNTAFSVFFTAKVPTGVAGQYKDAVAFYLPECSVTALAESDQDGVLVETINFTVSGNLNDDIFVSFI